MIKPLSPLPLSLCLLLLCYGAAGGPPTPATLILTNFASAPFPHPERAQGHHYHDEFYSAAEHYNDSTVALFAPTNFHPSGRIDFVVHFHGWRNNVTNVLEKYCVLDQFSASHRDAILIVPQGPRDAPDSFGGRLEDTNGFARFMDEAMRDLRDRGVIGDAKIGRIILSGHSGGYEVISAILARGGMTDRVQEVWLFDALYAHAERFVVWFDHHKGRFIDLYTEHGGTKDETENLMAALRENGVPFFAATDTAATDADLRKRHLVFLFSETPHDELLQTRNLFQRFLDTSSLKAGK